MKNINPPELNLKNLFNEIARDFSRTRQRPWKETVRFLDSVQAERGNESGEQTLLDLGCGNGRNTLHALENGFMVFALDFSLELLKILNKSAIDQPFFSRLHLLNADLLAVPLKEGAVNSAISIAALHHLPTREKRALALQESKRVLKQGGQELISVWAFDQERFQRDYHHHLSTHSVDDERFGNIFVDWKLGCRDSGKEVLKRFYHLFVKGELGSLCESAGFTDVSEFRAGDNYYAMVVK